MNLLTSKTHVCFLATREQPPDGDATIELSAASDRLHTGALRHRAPTPYMAHVSVLQTLTTTAAHPVHGLAGSHAELARFHPHTHRLASGRAEQGSLGFQRVVARTTPQLPARMHSA